MSRWHVNHNLDRPIVTVLNENENDYQTEELQGLITAAKESRDINKNQNQNQINQNDKDETNASDLKGLLHDK